MARTDPVIYTRFPNGLKARLDAAALESRRSLTAEMTARLEQSFGGATTSTAEDIRAIRALLERHFGAGVAHG